MDADETVLQDAALEVRPQLALDEARQPSLVGKLGGAREEQVEVLGDDLMEQGLLRLASAMIPGVVHAWGYRCFLVHRNDTTSASR